MGKTGKGVLSDMRETVSDLSSISGPRGRVGENLSVSFVRSFVNEVNLKNLLEYASISAQNIRIGFAASWRTP